MIYANIKNNKVGSKDITCFYGLNRTENINDFQLSNMKNLDCETFPFVSTRKKREKLYPIDDTKSRMKLICRDSDVFDDYLVTGINVDGKFVYRGDVFPNTDYTSVTSMTMVMGRYVMFPTLKHVFVDGGTLTGGTCYDVPYPYSTDFAKVSYNTSKRELIKVYQDRMEFKTNRGLQYDDSLEEFRSYLISGAFDPGTYCRLEFNEEYMDPGAYIIIENLYVERWVNGKREPVDTSGGMASIFTDTHDGDVYFVTMEFSAYKKDGNWYDISGFFDFEKDYFSAGKEAETMSSDLEVEFIEPPMVFGESFGGRLFACDDLGVSVYYTSGGTDFLNFRAKDSGSSAGALLCADPGKWTAMCAYRDALYVFKRNAMYRIYSTDGLTFYLERIADVGAVGKDAVCVVGNVMYFLSTEGLMRFSGSYPEYLPDFLGRSYKNGALGGNDKKLFCSLTYEDAGEDKTELLVYHIDRGIYSGHDDFKATQFIWFGGELYALGVDGIVYKMDSGEEAQAFSLDTKHYFVSFTKKAVNAVRLYFTFDPVDEDGFLEVLVSRDGGEFEPYKPKMKNGNVRYVPVRFCKCDEFCIRVQGKGIFTFKGMSMAMYQGGDIKQNR